MASIVYEGVGGGGDLFAGMKFFIIQRVPTRNRWLELVEANGGEIVPLEKQADMLIGDHARKDGLQGFYSWKYIEQSVTKGRLEDREPYLIENREKSGRPVGSNLPKKLRRTPFTVADDTFLMREMMKAERKGKALKGNTVFQEIEHKNPRHPYQAWRDRWIKQVSNYERPNDADQEEEEADEESQETGVAVGQRRVSANVPSKSTSSSAARQTQKAPNPVPKSVPFSAEDVKELLDVYSDILNIDEEQKDAAWEQWAKLFTRHTAKEWEQFWITHVKPIAEERHRKAQKSAKVAGRTTVVSPHPGLQSLSSLKRKRNPSAEPVPKQAIRAPQSKGDDVHSEDLFQHSATVVLSSPSPPPSPPLTKRHDSSKSKVVAQRDDEQSEFIGELEKFTENQQISIPDLEPIVCGRKLSLYTIWKTMQLPEFGDFDAVEGSKRWAPFATKLNFNTFSQETAPEELRSIYENDLMDFDEFRNTFLPAFQLQEQMQRQTEGELVSDFDETDLDFSSSGCVGPADLFTTAGPLSESGVIYRTKDKGKGREIEIPPTPEDVYNAQPTYRDNPSPLRQRFNFVENNFENDEEDEAEADELFVRRNLFPTTKSPTVPVPKVPTEPDTQDFRFSTPNLEPHRHLDHEFDSPLSNQTQDDVLAAHLQDSNEKGSEAAVAGSVNEDSSTQSQSDSQRREAEMLAEVDRWSALGYEDDIVVQAIMATSGETGDLGVVIESLKSGRGIPNNIQGVWTESDDEVVSSKDAKEYARVVRKHGEARCVKRRQFNA